MTAEMTTGQRIRRFRIVKALTQTELASHLGIASSISVSQWERDKVFPNKSVRERLKLMGLTEPLTRNHTDKRRSSLPAATGRTPPTAKTKKPRTQTGLQPCIHCGHTTFLNGKCESCGV